MDKKDFIFPGVILGLVIITGLGILLTHADTTKLIPSQSMATSTIGTTASTTSTGGAGQTSTKPNSPSAYYPYGKLTLALNQAAQFRDGVAIRALQVTEDSRCPQEVQCIQAGTVKISLKTSVQGNSHIETLELGHSLSVGSDTITLEAVSPGRSKDGAPASGSYRFTFTVTHGGVVSSAGPCYVGGCSAQLCSDSPGAVSTCEYRAEYGCYRTATCERQSNGSCGWTQTSELKSCLANPPAEL